MCGWYISNRLYHMQKEAYALPWTEKIQFFSRVQQTVPNQSHCVYAIAQKMAKCVWLARCGNAIYGGEKCPNKLLPWKRNSVDERDLKMRMARDAIVDKHENICFSLSELTFNAFQIGTNNWWHFMFTYITYSVTRLPCETTTGNNNNNNNHNQNSNLPVNCRNSWSVCLMIRWMTAIPMLTGRMDSMSCSHLAATMNRPDYYQWALCQMYQYNCRLSMNSTKMSLIQIMNCVGHRFLT